MQYRSEIDGLRAIAVLWVFLFHLDFSFIPGGFVGVDIFYVISGFVIFRSLLNDFAQDRLSISGFYKRRVRRILPAVTVTILVSLALGLWLLTPRELIAFAESAIASALSVSNFYFNAELSYFADAARTIPLLHTWSLGVEEQFYLIAPVLMLVLARKWGRAGIVWGLTVISAFSFVYGLVALYGLEDANHAFYLPMGRFWEIGIGGLLACAEPSLRPDKTSARAISVAGLAGIIASGIWITEHSAFPGYVALLPVLSTACLIVAGNSSANPVNAVLRLRPMRFIGDISFSLYLFHWPAIVFVGLYLARPLDTFEKLILLGATIALSALNWRAIETPFRKAVTAVQWRRAKRAIISGLLASVSVCVGIIVLDGVPQRLPKPALAVHEHMQNLNLSLSDCQPVQRWPAPRKARLCSFSGQQDRYDYLLWGDSHAGMMAPALDRAMQAQGQHGVMASLPGCHALVDTTTPRRKNRDACIALSKLVIEMIAQEQIPLVIVVGRWANLLSNVGAPGDGKHPEPLLDVANHEAPIRLERALRRTVQAIEQAGAKVMVIGPTPEVDFHVPAAMIRSHITGRPLPALATARFEQRQSLTLPMLAALAQNEAAVFYPHRFLCNQTHCQTHNDAMPFYRDDDHLTDHGMNVFINELTDAIGAVQTLR